VLFGIELNQVDILVPFSFFFFLFFSFSFSKTSLDLIKRNPEKRALFDYALGDAQVFSFSFYFLPIFILSF